MLLDYLECPSVRVISSDEDHLGDVKEMGEGPTHSRQELSNSGRIQQTCTEGEVHTFQTPFARGIPTGLQGVHIIFLA